MKGQAKTYGEWLKSKADGDKQRRDVKKEATEPSIKKTTNDGSTSIDGFPNSLANLETVHHLGGSTGAVLMRDPATGKQYVYKKGDSAAHIEEEMLADSLYAEAGAKVPRFKRYETSEGPAKLAEYVEGRTLNEYLKTASSADKERVLGSLSQHFAADALLGNWDVIGLEEDNVIVDADGNPWRIDNGGSLRYRAQGGSKGADWNSYPTELWSMRDPQTNPNAASAFGSLSHREVVDQVKALGSKQQAMLDKVKNPELKKRLTERLDNMQSMGEVSDRFFADKWKDDYTGEFARHWMGLQAAGITERFPKSLNMGDEDIEVLVDENGLEFDSLRGTNSITNDLIDYVNNAGGDMGIIDDWAADQSNDSWDVAPQALKHWMATNRDVPLSKHYWYEEEDTARELSQEAVETYGEETYRKTLAAQHAFTYLLLSKTEMPNPVKNNKLQVYRTEELAVMYEYDIEVGKNRKMKRGPLESGSLVSFVEAMGGTERTVQQVPLERIFATYVQAEGRNSKEGRFMADFENEVLFVPEGISFEYQPSEQYRQEYD